jgi:hypothetical protein
VGPMSDDLKKANPRVAHLLAFLRLLTPANFALSFSYLRKFGIRLYFARTVYLLSLALGVRRPDASTGDQSPAHKARDGREPLPRKMPDGPPTLNGSRDALKLELAAIKDGLMDSLRHTRNNNG